MFLVIGLGNVGCKYNNTYHNLGFECVDKLISKYDVLKKKELGYVSLIWINMHGHKVIVAKPKTYMNLSGSAVMNVCKSYKIDYNNIIVALDDIDLDKGMMRFRTSGSGGTHKGLKDIVDRLGTKQFARVRIGFGPKPDKILLEKYVLKHIPKEEREIILPVIDKAVDKIVEYILGIKND